MRGQPSGFSGNADEVISVRVKAGCASCVRLPFSVDRSSRIKLPYQVADGIRSAIYSGFWKPGDRLPSSREMKELLGVSVRAPLEAFQILAKEGLIAVREKCGAVVNALHTPLTKGRILMILPGGAQVQSTNLFMENIKRCLNEAGYMVVTTSVFRKNGAYVKNDPNPFDLRQLEVDLKMAYSLVVLEGGTPTAAGIVQMLRSCGIPFVVANGPRADAENCIGGVDFDESDVIESVVSDCRRTRVRTIGIVQKWEKDGIDVMAAFCGSGVKVRKIQVPQMRGRGRKEELWSEAYALFERNFTKKGKAWLPDVLYFTDDHCFWGAVISLLANGVKVPADVRLLTRSNAGMRPQFTCPVACLERDFHKSGVVAARTILDYLEKGIPIPAGRILRSSYVRGGTFP